MLLATIITAIKQVDILNDIIHVTSYCTSSHHCPCHSESCANHATQLAIVVATSYKLSSSPPAPSLTLTHHCVFYNFLVSLSL